MVLRSCGQEVTEKELRDLCDCDDDGTRPRKALECATHYGFDAIEAFLDISTLRKELIAGAYPITYLELEGPYGSTRHAVVVTGITHTSVQMLDPSLGERDLMMENFVDAWQVTNGQTLLIRC